MINLFFIKKNFSGVATYSKELLSNFTNSDDIFVYVINIDKSHTEYKEIRKDTNMIILCIPLFIDYGIIDEKFAIHILYLIGHHIYNKSNVIFHLNCSSQTFLGIEARKRFSAKIVCTVHFLPSYFYSSYLKDISPKTIATSGDKMEQLLLKNADIIICVTNFAREMINRFYLVPFSKMITIYNGFGSLEEKEKEKEKSLIKKKLGFEVVDQIILYVGRLSYVKGVHTLIKAFDYLHLKNPKLKLVLIGEGNYTDCFAVDCNAKGSVIFTGKISQKKLIDFYSIAKIGVIPSFFEQCSYVALEMMKYGIPILSSNSPGLRELFTSNTAMLFNLSTKEGDVELEISDGYLAEKIEELLTTDSFRVNQMTRNAKKNWKKRHTAKEMAQKTFREYKLLTQ